MNYKHLFKPPPAENGHYVYQDNVILAVNVALATNRPILITGPSGCGKSSLAEDVARILGREFDKQVITSRTQAVELLYTVDNLKKLQDAHRRDYFADESEYVEPGILWRAFDPESAAVKKASAQVEDEGRKAMVVLLDEIDKADPDLPNNLLEPLGDFKFSVKELDKAVVTARRKPLVMITTNNERRLADAFIRRCVLLSLDRPDVKTLLMIAEQQLKTQLAVYRGRNPGTTVLEDVAAIVTKISTYSTAEYLDTLQAIFELNIDPTEANYRELAGVTVKKEDARSIGM